MIEFTKLTLNGFMSYKDKQKVPLAEQGLVHIEGINKDESGSNRSGKSAILEGLVWCLFKRTIRGIKNDAVVNRFSKEGCYADVQFRANDIGYRIRRYQRSRKYGNSVRLWIEKKEFTSRHGEDTQEKIERVLGCDYNSFVNSVVFGGVKPFASLTDAEQKKVLESFLHFEKIDAALTYTKVQLGIAKDAIQVIRESEAEILGKVSANRDTLKSLRDSLRTYDSERLEARRRVFKAISALVGLKPSRPSQKALKRAERKLREIEKKIDRNPRCKACGQNLPASSEMEKEIAYAEKAVTKAKNKLEEYEDNLTDWRRQRKELKEKLYELESSEVPFAADLDKLASKQAHNVKKLLRLKFEEARYNREVKDLEFWVKGFGNQGIKALIVRQALPMMNEKLKEYSQEIFDETVELIFSPTKRNKKSDVEKELFNLTYKSRFGADSYLGESAGGRRRVDICVLLTFSWLSQFCNLLLVDECLDGLDAQGKESVLEILSKLRGTVLVISHSKELQAKGKVWTVTKRKGISTLTNA